MHHRLAKKAGVLMTVAATIGVLVFGASEALAAQGLRQRSQCEEGTNWCALGQANCNNCCGELGGFCTSMDPGPDQGCICYS